jgi:hypothetical protein
MPIKTGASGPPAGGQSKNSEKTGHRFVPGNRFGKGRPQGSRNKATIALQSLLDKEGAAITRKAIELAKAGDTTALRLVLERLIPPARERRLELQIPNLGTLGTAAAVTAAMGTVLQAVAAGDITPGEGQAVVGLLEGMRRGIETADLESRVEKLEKQTDEKGKR